MASKALAFLLVAFILLSSKDPRMTYGLGGLDPAHSPVKAPAPVKSQLPPPPHPIAKPPTAPLMPPVRSKADCIPLCDHRCSLHSRKRVCLRACMTCCDRCRCVPPGTYGNREMCGKCYSDMRTHGNQLKCP